VDPVGGTITQVLFTARLQWLGAPSQSTASIMPPHALQKPRYTFTVVGTFLYH
jgi:hypothetical protein